jgi:hypothetical protein
MNSSKCGPILCCMSSRRLAYFVARPVHFHWQCAQSPFARCSLYFFPGSTCNRSHNFLSHCSTLSLRNICWRLENPESQCIFVSLRFPIKCQRRVVVPRKIPTIAALCARQGRPLHVEPQYLAVMYTRTVTPRRYEGVPHEPQLVEEYKPRTQEKVWVLSGWDFCRYVARRHCANPSFLPCPFTEPY